MGGEGGESPRKNLGMGGGGGEGIKRKNIENTQKSQNRDQSGPRSKNQKNFLFWAKNR